MKNEKLKPEEKRQRGNTANSCGAETTDVPANSDGTAGIVTMTGGNGTMDTVTTTSGNGSADSPAGAGGFSMANGSGSLKDGQKRTVYPDYEDTETSQLKEPEVAYGRRKSQEEYTLDDYYALPDDIRAELIDGQLYLMSCPSLNHQRILTRLTSLLYQYVDGKNGDCEVFCAPFDVQLDCDFWTMVQPDVMIICDPDKILNNKVAEKNKKVLVIFFYLCYTAKAVAKKVGLSECCA